MECEYCGTILSSEMALKQHQATTKYCLDIQGKHFNDKFQCTYCKREFTVKQNLTRHQKTCRYKKTEDNNKKDKQIELYKVELNDKNTTIRNLLEENKRLHDTILHITLNIIKHSDVTINDIGGAPELEGDVSK